MQSSRIILLALVALLGVDKPAYCSDADKAPTAHKGEKMLHGAVDEVQHAQQGSATDVNLRIARPTASDQQSTLTKTSGNSPDVPLLDVSQQSNVRPPLLTVQDMHHSKQEGLGLLGMYALCADNSRIPYYITNVFPPSELTQCGVESGDLLTRINGVSPFDYMHSIHPIKPGALITLTFEHHGIPKVVSAKLQDMRTFTPFFESYSHWATSHISFLQEHQGQYHSCGLF